MDITLDTPATQESPKPETPTLRYPVLMQAIPNKHIVLFRSETEGTILHGGEAPMIVGYHTDSWISATDKSFWTPFTGTLPLRNTTTP